MEVRGGNGCGMMRNRSPERSAGGRVVRVIKPTVKKVQVVYYLSKNGQLEHPHYLEVSHLAHQHLRLKDVTDRLTVLRGRGMPSLYSWSCKRSYKSGYVWNDLTENDIICPSEGADEYVLKGSELIQACTEKFQQLRVGNSAEVPDPTCFNPKHRKIQHPKRHLESEQVCKNGYEDDEEEEEECEEKTSYTMPNTPLLSRCSRGVSTEGLESQQNEENSSPPSTTSSTVSEKEAIQSNNSSKRFEDGEPVATESVQGRNSMLYHLIACGSSVSFRGKSTPVLKQQTLGSMGMEAGRKSNSLHRGVLCKTAVAAAKVVAEEDEIKCMSENPRFGNLQSEEKEYFSGSIVEAMSEEIRARADQPVLKKSSSYNEERSSKSCLGEEEIILKEEMKRERGVKGKCIPRSKKSSSSSSKQSKK